MTDGVRPAHTQGADDPRAAAPTTAVVVRTRIMPPPLRPGLLARPALVAQLADNPARRLVLLVAPAGWGKTTLLTQWCALPTTPPVAWFSLDPGDNDPTQWLRHLIAAVQQVAPACGHAALAAGYGGAAADDTLAISLLINDLVAAPRCLALVFDDYHLITAPAIHTLVAFLLDYAPPTLQVVIATRTPPPLPIARLRARGEVAEIDAAQLRFSVAEADHFLGQVMQLQLAPADVAALAEHTQGWVAGLQLAGLALQRGQGQGPPPAALSGAHRFVQTYIAEEVLSRLPAPLRTFLLHTAPLTRLSASLCDAVTQRSDSRSTLVALEAAQLFLTPLDHAAGWYCYHPLFAEALCSLLRTEDPGAIATVQRRASAWYAAQGLLAEAVGYALAAPDHGQAAELVEASFLDLLLQGEGATVLRWLAQLPEPIVAQRPPLWLAAAGAQIVAGRYPEADPWLARLAACSLDRAHTRLLQTLQAHNAYYRGDIPAATSLAQAALGQEQQLTSAAPSPLPQAVVPAATVILAAALAASGRPDEARQTLRRTLAQTQPVPLAPYRYAGAMLAALQISLADLLYDADDLALARQHAALGAELGRQSGYLAYQAYGLALLARIDQAQGDHAAALAQSDAAERLVATLQLTDDIALTVAKWSLALRIALGERAGLSAWQQRWNAVIGRDLPADADPPVLACAKAIITARWCLSQDDPAGAAAALAAAEVFTGAAPLPRLAVEVGILHALVRQAQLQQGLALDLLAQAVARAAPSGWVRPFVDEGAPMEALLRALRQRHATGDAPWVATDFLEHLIAATGTTRHAPALLPNARQPHAALSPREREVLRLLAAGHSNAAIAAQLVVTTGTVKRHLHNLYSKLGVTTRTQAVARARAQGLLTSS